MQPENCKPQKCDMNHVQYWASDNIRSHRMEL